jgi:phosphohistidine phosphatase
MRIYLMRHGEYASKEIDTHSPLSEKGREDIKNLANFLSHSNIHVSHIFHSGKLRAQQTATLLATGIFLENPISIRDGLDPIDSVIPIAYDLNNETNDIVLVGHQPFMSKLVGKLVTDDENANLVAFTPGTIVCLEKIGDKMWAISWILRPELLSWLTPKV